MQRERWEQVSQIFEAAIVLQPDEREDFILARCGGDEELRRDVEGLIEAHQKAVEEKFIDGQAAERASPLMAMNEDAIHYSAPRLREGQQIDHYEIRKLLGAGGMGEVYLAVDKNLDRTVALKILPTEVASDQRRMGRFKQEARAVSALNQPNILTIYEFGEVGDIHFLASEFIDGDTLRQQIAAGPMSLLTILDIGIQLCAALDAAHEAQIVHRDIKPENVMIRRRDSVVKVLDFGLAKLADRTSTVGHQTDTEAATEVLVKTTPGSIMGTFNYMSPEQAQGKPLDQRTDLWSVGIVIYEMVAGRSPFAGPTHNHTVVSILEKDPEPLSQVAKMNVPAELERIVAKSLAKNPDERYHSAKDLLVDLRNLRKHVELDTHARRSDPQGQKLTAPNFGRTTVEKKRPPKMAYIIGLTAILALAIIVVLVVWRPPSASPPATSPTVQRQLNYSITVQKYRDGQPYDEPFTLAKEINFERDYRVRLNVSSPQAGYLYILNETPDPIEPLSILFPSPTTNEGSAFVGENSVLTIPDNSWFSLDNDKGQEKIWLVWSGNTLPLFDSLRRFANHTDRGVISDPNLNSQALTFLRSNADGHSNAERDDKALRTTISSGRPVLVHLIPLEHH